jgi:hypothetical protein
MRPVRVSTVVWGVLLLLLGAGVFATTALDLQLFTAASALYVIVGIGALLVVAAIVGAVARAISPRQHPPVD